jgi:hypothetical protein
VKSRKFNLLLELPSRLRRFENEQCKQLPSREDNKEDDSTLFLPTRLFTQAGPGADVSGCSNISEQSSGYSITSSATASSDAGRPSQTFVLAQRLGTVTAIPVLAGSHHQ